MSKQVKSESHGAVIEGGRASLRLLEEHEQTTGVLRQALIDGENSGDAGELDMRQINDKARRRTG